jgi:hypothetical protein
MSEECRTAGQVRGSMGASSREIAESLLIALAGCAVVYAAMLTLRAQSPVPALVCPSIVVTRRAVVALAAVAGAVLLRAAVVVRSATVIPEDALLDIIRNVERGERVEAMAVCVTRPSPMGEIIFRGLAGATRGRVRALACARREAEAQAIRLESATDLALAMGRVAPLVALAGFALTMTSRFAVSIARHPGGFVPAELLGPALSPLAMALAVAAVCRGAHGLIRSRAGRLAREARAVALAIVDNAAPTRV